MNRERILFADDDPQIRALTTRILESHGYRCDTATDAADAEARLDSCDEYAVLLSDVDMPGGSGLDLVRRVAWSHPELAVLMVAGSDRREVYEAALDLGCYGYILKPFEASELVIAVMGALRRRRLERDARGRRAALEDAVSLRTAALERSRAALVRSQEETIRRLSRALELRDALTGEHVERVSHVSDLVGRQLGLGELERELLRLASPLHDVGKIGIPDPILRKPAALSSAELAIMRLHPQTGYDILAGTESELLEHAASIALTHHERWDGSGYPRGLRGTAIPLEGRIVAIADVFDALTSDRPYRRAFTHDQAIALLAGERGGHFDPDVLDALLAAVPDLGHARAHLLPKAAA